ncbi:MAG: hypothetical protein J4F98_13755 [Acidobacteria bacterium]|nr:hypothetical protein [Acidobacteriota bacterium]
MKKKRTRKAERRVVAVAHPSYQPAVAELREDQGIKGPFDQAVDALTKPVEVKYVKPRKTR